MPSDNAATAAKPRVLIVLMILTPSLRAPNHFGGLGGEEGFFGIPASSTLRWETAGTKIMANVCNTLLCSAVEYAADDRKYTDPREIGSHSLRSR
jgi:hypothetical protein